MIEPAQIQTLKISKPEVKFWRSEVQSSEDFQKKEFIDRLGYEKLIKFYESEQHPDESNPYQITQQDEIYPSISSIVSSTYYQNPTVSTTAKHPIADQVIQLPFTAQVAMMQTGMQQDYSEWDVTYNDLMRDALTYAIRKHGLKGEAQLALFDLIAAGFCVIEVNHMTQSDFPASEDNEFEDSVEGIMGKAKEAFKSMASFIGEKSAKSEKTDQEAEEKVASEVDNEGRDYTFDSTYIERWNPTHILFDYRAEVFKKSRFIAKYIDMTIADFNVKFPKFSGKI